MGREVSSGTWLEVCLVFSCLTTDLSGTTRTVPYRFVSFDVTAVTDPRPISRATTVENVHVRNT